MSIVAEQRRVTQAATRVSPSLRIAAGADMTDPESLVDAYEDARIAAGAQGDSDPDMDEALRRAREAGRTGGRS